MDMATFTALCDSPNGESVDYLGQVRFQSPMSPNVALSTANVPFLDFLKTCQKTVVTYRDSMQDCTRDVCRWV